jgi:hypothetical protein
MVRTMIGTRSSCAPASRVWMSLADLRMAISLTDDEIGLLKQLKAAGEHGRATRALNSDAALARLIPPAQFPYV